MSRRVAIYARVSTEHEAQVSALANQIQYYDEYLGRHPELELYDRYVDEGLSATSYKKRPEYLRMIEDAKDKKFSLILTREVSRFARNILDAIEQTRMLKECGVEVRFIEDGISTMNDEDGELRLSIMAILAQNESKKISSRVKAGQMISFKNGVPYGNGNILGYDRVGREYVINPEQAETVRRIFDLSLGGCGIRKIHYELEKEGRKTATGLDRWQDTVILRVLRNPFYCGRVEYRKQYTPDYLKQKKVENRGEVEKIVVMGAHVPIVTEEEFDRVQEMLASRSVAAEGGGRRGKPPAKSVWVKKLRCSCGSTMSRRVSYTAKSGAQTFTYQCRRQSRTGSVRTREKKGLPTDGICDVRSFPEWKLKVQADFIFRKLMANKQEIYDAALMMLKEIADEDAADGEADAEREENLRKISGMERRLEAYADMCADGDISRETYRRKKAETEERIRALEERNAALSGTADASKAAKEKEARLGVLAEFLKVRAFEEDAPVPERLIDEFVKEIVVDNGSFTWILAPGVSAEEEVVFDAASLVRPKAGSTYSADGSTGCGRQRALTPVFLGTFTVPEWYAGAVRPYYLPGMRPRKCGDMTIKVGIA